MQVKRPRGRSAWAATAPQTPIPERSGSLFGVFVMPVPPKHPSVRARTNRSATIATLKADAAISAPGLPDREWHDMTVEWWQDVWSSPMAPEYDASDRHGLFMLAALVDDFWNATSQTARRKAAAEIRQQGMRFGLSPIDRRRLQWEIEKTEETQAKGATRRQDAAPSGRRPRKADPRTELHSV